MGITAKTISATSPNSPDSPVLVRSSAAFPGPRPFRCGRNRQNLRPHASASVRRGLKFGKFGAEIGGDLSDYKTGAYEDIERALN